MQKSTVKSKVYSIQQEELVRNYNFKSLIIYKRNKNINYLRIQFSSVQLLSHVRLFVTPWAAAHQATCPSPTPRVYSNSCPLCRSCHPAISYSVVPFSCLQSFSAPGAFQMNQFFASCGQSIGVSASASVLPVNMQDWFPLGLTGLISLQSPTPQFKSINSLVLGLLYGATLISIHDQWKNHSLDYTDLCQQSDVCAFLICCSLGLS